MACKPSMWPPSPFPKIHGMAACMLPNCEGRPLLFPCVTSTLKVMAGMQHIYVPSFLVLMYRGWRILTVAVCCLCVPVHSPAGGYIYSNYYLLEDNEGRQCVAFPCMWCLPLGLLSTRRREPCVWYREENILVTALFSFCGGFYFLLFNSISNHVDSSIYLMSQKMLPLCTHS